MNADTKAIVRNALEHIGEGLLLMAVFAPLTIYVTGAVLGTWIAWALQAAYWLGHETRDQEIHLQVAAGRGLTSMESLSALLFWRYNADGKRDLLFPLFVNMLVPIIVMALQ